jgi:hypothetical protein
MPVIDQELQEFEALLEYMEQAELAKLGFPTRGAARGEKGLYVLYKQEGWTVLPGIPGHKLTSPGPDLVAWRQFGPMVVMRIVDNKSGDTKKKIDRATALTPRSLMRNLGPIIASLHRKRPRPALAREARDLLWKSLEAVVEDKPLPPQVKLYVTNFDGVATGVAPALMQGTYKVEFDDVEARHQKQKAALDAEREAERLWPW